MLTNLPLFIGLRYMRSKRRDNFVSFISLFSLAAMAIGVMALIVVLSVMNGFDREIKMRLLRVVPHVTLTSPQGLDIAQINQLEAELKAGSDNAPVQVLSVVPMLQSFVMGSSKGNQAGLVLQGIDPESRTGEKLAENMISGYVGQLQAGEFGVVIGSQVARKLDLFVGDRLQLTLPSVTVTPAGVFPRIKRVTVTGIFQVGAQVDASVVFMHYRDGQKLLRLGDRFQGVQLELSDAFMADNWLGSQGDKNFLADRPKDDLQWRTWSDNMGTLFQAMRMEKVIVSLLLSVIIAVAAFNIVASLVLMVSDKRKDIAVIRTLGATSGTVMKIFVIQGLAVGSLGILAGTVLGCLLAYFVGDIVAGLEALSGSYIFDPSIYLISALPSEIIVSDVAVVVGGALVISFLATLYPAWRAGKVLPAEALRYDH
ncbi:lipoprotein-releasing ABC transporter permease subunit [Porticoccaceae bacterium]|jgi:lipoprotein-releasing system permease protein|nr:lipoprotein-releasing ABC transporter permease subunit [Porticoccaceae bacterium]MDB4581140.1 lipoprotein-releasing ABC transporter permease subunit [Porticoccaceae bacterium]MDC0517302.1 lipoprotein-releasing ABC transporter permease subunit [Porticoccaceae bacterium]MDC0588811.1 lipoprotein-releasing ABC transporter permease subunit [Porticoccaceae bacterium]